MGLRFYRRVRLAPGLTLNLSKRGVSASVGVRGAHVTVGRDGVRETVGLPGTELSYTETQKAGASGLTLRRPLSRLMTFSPCQSLTATRSR
jgi:hypothetical protein